MRKSNSSTSRKNGILEVRQLNPNSRGGIQVSSSELFTVLLLSGIFPFNLTTHGGHSSVDGKD